MSGEGAALIKGPLIEAPLQFRMESGGKRASRNSFVNCPKCDAPAFVRRSDRVTETTTQLVCHCTDSGCGHTYRADIVFVHTLVEGNIERPDLDLPVCPRDQVPHIRPPVGESHDGEPTFFEPPPPARATG
ncbi:ogr/Delta-like zinc finger family protein [Erythrobacter sp. EC-HK427]|uniref:ogr/Delta-like zinc finger family protein n=1 Tax=Erythrobacter sp. EC-HK427 TaxID=2038396 RepID=UPI00125B1EC9|nr:ogr/Delta-like zinc finger family protein [Erythrobacter sp. EC-HK427]VVT07215.1 conserved hypothetical protein [Erythrobacter sp. EC-HK427]